MLRHYESLGLLGDVVRTDSNYRQYSLADVHTLRFIRRARDMGFGLDAITELVSLWHNRKRSSASVKRITRKSTTTNSPSASKPCRPCSARSTACWPLPGRRPARLPDPGRPRPPGRTIRRSAKSGTKLYKPATSAAPRRNTPRPH